MGFLAKNESSSSPWPHSFAIKSLSEIVGPNEEERVLCPMRALRFYLYRTKKIHGPSNVSWCSVKNPSRPLSKNALAFFLRDLISEAHSSVEGGVFPLCKMRAHEIRAVATLLVFKCNLSLSSILQVTF